jgi:preprotein translocase subunit SecE
MNATKEKSADPGAPEDQEPLAEPSALATGVPHDPAVTSTASLGLSRWIQYVFVVIAALLLWFLDKAATVVWQNFAEPPAVVITALSAVGSLAITVFLYRNERTRDLVTDVVTELSKVTWPSRKETYASTIVVVITSLIAAAIIGAFDFVWSYVTDFLYKHKV